MNGVLDRRTASMDSIRELGRLKKNRERSNTPRVVRSFCALSAFSRTGKNTWSAFCAPTMTTCEFKPKSCYGDLRFRCSRTCLVPKSLSSASRPSRISAYSATAEMSLCYHNQNGILLPSVDAFTATNRSKFSSTSTRIASDRESRPTLRCAIPEERSW